MTTVASLVANPILLRNNHQKFTAVKLSATCNSRHAPKFNSARVKCFFSAADLTNTTTYDSKNSGRHASLCKRPHAIKDHLGIGKPLGRVGGKWSSAYPYDAQSPNPSDSPWFVVHVYISFFLLLSICVCGGYGPLSFKAFIMMLLAAPMALHSWSCGETSVVKLQVYPMSSTILILILYLCYLYIWSSTDDWIDDI